MRVRTDHKMHGFRYRDEVPSAILANQFSHLSEDDAPDGFLRYRRFWYHTSDFERVPLGRLSDLGWQGIHPDSFFSGVVIAISQDGEAYVIGTVLG